MKRIALAALLTTATATSALAAGLDRSGQSVLAIFDESNTGSVSVAHVNPSVSGTDTSGSGTTSYDTNESYTQVFASYANEINDTLSYAVIIDQPYGINLNYGGAPTADYFGGTKAELTSTALTVLLKHAFNEQFSAFGGIRAQEIDGDISLNGVGYSTTLGGIVAAAGAGGASDFQNNGGYRAKYDPSWGTGVVVGAAYEVPEIALRAVLTYSNEITHNTNVTETSGANTVGSATGSFQTPQSINFDFQTGINETTLLLASVRWTDWDDFALTPPTLGNNLASISSEFRYSVGAAKRFTDELVGLATIIYEKDGGKASGSALGPSDGLIGLSLGARYSSGNMNISGGVGYTKIGDAVAATGPFEALFTNNSAVSFGLKVQYEF